MLRFTPPLLVILLLPVLLLFLVLTTTESLFISAAPTTRDCTTAVNRIVDGGTHPDGIIFSAVACDTIVIRDVIVGTNIKIKVATINSLSITNVVFEGPIASDILIHFHEPGSVQQAFTGTFFIDNVTVNNATANLRDFIFFSNEVEFRGGSNRVQNNNVTLREPLATTFSSFIFFKKKAVIINAFSVLNNIVTSHSIRTELIAYESTVICNRPYVNENKYGVIVYNNTITVNNNPTEGLGFSILSAYVNTSIWNVTNLLVAENRISVDSITHVATSRYNQLLFFREIGPPEIVSGTTINKQYVILVRDNNFTVKTEDESSIVYFYNAITTDIDLNVSIINNNCSIESGTGMVLANFDEEINRLKLTLAGNYVSFSLTPYKLRNSWWNYPVYFGGNFVDRYVGDSFIVFENNTINSYHYHASRFYLRFSSLAHIGKIAISNNDFKIITVDHKLASAEIAAVITSANSTNTSLSLRNNSIELHFQSDNASLDRSYSPSLGFGRGELNRGENESRIENDFEVVGNTMKVTYNSGLAREDVPFALQLSAFVIRAYSNKTSVLIENNIVDAPFNTKNRFVVIKDPDEVTKLVIRNNTVTCGFQGASKGANNKTGNCRDNNLLHVMRKVDAATSTRRLVQVIVEDNKMISKCTLPSHTSQDFAMYPPHALVESNNSLFENLMIRNNQFEHSHCSGAQLARFILTPSETDVASTFKTNLAVPLMFQKVLIENNTISTNRCQPSCDFVALQPEYNKTLLAGANKSKEVVVNENFDYLNVTKNRFIMDTSATNSSSNTTNLVSFISFCPFQSETVESDKNQVETNCESFYQNGVVESLAVTSIMSNQMINFTQNTIGCSSALGGDSQLSSSCDFDQSSNFSTLLVLSATPRTIGKGLFTLRNNDLTRRFYTSSSSSFFPQRPGLPGLSLSQTSVRIYCDNEWSRNFQRTIMSSSATSGGLCRGAASCEKVMSEFGGSCYSESKSLTVSHSMESNSMTESDEDGLYSISALSNTSTYSESLILSGSRNESSRSLSKTLSDSDTFHNVTTTTTSPPSTTTSSSSTTTSSTTTSTSTSSTTSTTTSTTTTTATPPPQPKTKSKTISISVLPPTTTPAPPPPTPPPVPQAVAASSTAATSVSAALSIEPSAPMVASRTMSLAVISSTCKHGYVQNIEETKRQTAPLEFPQSLMPFLSIGTSETDGWRGNLRGAVLANIVIVPILITLVVIGFAYVAERLQVKMEFKRAQEEKRLPQKRHTDLLVKCKAFAVFGITLGVGLEGATFAVVSLLSTSATVVENGGAEPTISKNDDIVICIFCGILPIALILYFFTSRLTRVLFFCSCDPAALRKGKAAEREMKEVFKSSSVIKFLQLLFGNECWVRDSDERISEELQKERGIDLKEEQSTLLENENERLSSIPSDMRKTRVKPREVVSENQSSEATQLLRDVTEVREFMLRMQPRVSCLHARFKGPSKNRDKMLFLNEDGEENTTQSLSALAAAAAKSDAEKNSFKSNIRRVARKISPYTFIVDCALNIAMGIVRGGVTVGLLSCSVAGSLVVMIVILALLYSVIVTPRISTLSCYVDILVNTLIVVSGFLALFEADATASLASTSVTVLAVFSLSVSSSRLYLVLFQKIQLFPYNTDGKLLISANSGNVDGDQNGKNDTTSTAIGGLGASDGNSALFLLENFVSVFSSPSPSKKKNNNNNVVENGGFHNIHEDEGDPSISLALGGVPQEMSTINPNLTKHNNNNNKNGSSNNDNDDDADDFEKYFAELDGGANKKDNTNNEDDEDFMIDLDLDLAELSADLDGNNMPPKENDNNKAGNDNGTPITINWDDVDDDEDNNNKVRAESSITGADALPDTKDDLSMSLLKNSVNMGGAKNEELLRRQRELEMFLGTKKKSDNTASSSSNRRKSRDNTLEFL